MLIQSYGLIGSIRTRIEAVACKNRQLLKYEVHLVLLARGKSRNSETLTPNTMTVRRNPIP